MHFGTAIIAISFSSLLGLSCASRSVTGKHALGSPDPAKIKYPGGQPPSVEAIELGKALFFDARLSFNNTKSCASCHNPAQGLSEAQAFSTGATGEKLKRNTPALFNLAWSSHFFWDGRAGSLEQQVLTVIPAPAEMNMPLDELTRKLNQVPFYRQAFEKVYPASGLTAPNIAQAIAAFERTLISRNSPFDRYAAGETSAMSAAAIRGLTLFKGKARCIACHHGPNFTDGDFHNTGVLSDDLGRRKFDQFGFKKEFEIKPYPFFSSLGAFKTPGLRNVELTAPYMHNGSEPTLADVVDFYNQGSRNPRQRGLAQEIRPLFLSRQEMDDLVAFMKALTSPVEIMPPVIPAD